MSLPFGDNEKYYETEEDGFTGYIESDTWSDSDHTPVVQNNGLMRINPDELFNVEQQEPTDENEQYVEHCIAQLGKYIQKQLYDINGHMNMKNMNYYHYEPNEKRKHILEKLLNIDLNITENLYVESLSFFNMNRPDINIKQKLMDLLTIILNNKDVEYEHLLNILYSDINYQGLRLLVKSCYYNNMDSPYRIDELYVLPIMKNIFEEMFVKHFYNK